MSIGDPNLDVIRQLGTGGFGQVLLCKMVDQNTENHVAVKRLYVKRNGIQMEMIMKEIYIMSKVKHPNIVNFLRSFVHAGTVNIVMEYLTKGTMRDKIRLYPQGLPASSLPLYFCDMFMGLEYLHIRRVIHSDIKPENMLIDAFDRVKIGDFGISAIVKGYNTSHNYQGGTVHYVAPEGARSGITDFKSDVWSLGCILYEMCMGHNPFIGAKTLQELLVKLERQKIDYSRISLHYGYGWAGMCEHMMTVDPQKRASLHDLLRLHTQFAVLVYQEYFNYYN